MMHGDRLAPSAMGPLQGEGYSLMRLHEEQAVTAVGVAAGAYVGAKYGGALPAFGPLSGPLLLIVIGALVSTILNTSGTTGEAVKGFGFGLVGVGVLGLVG